MFFYGFFCISVILVHIFPFSFLIYFLSMETVTAFIFLDSKITVDSECSLEIKRRLLLGRKTMTNLDSVLKSKDSPLPTKIHIVKDMGFSSSHVQM